MILNPSKVLLLLFRVCVVFPQSKAHRMNVNEWLLQMYCDLRCVHRLGRDKNDSCGRLYDPNNSTTSFVPKQLLPYYSQFPNHVEVVGYRLFDDLQLNDSKILIKNASFIATTFVRKAS
ncbi:hypothetical protein M3Y96_00544000 [Aphelenchoides besseyi]|nr:hypothetical protein M3Y96_00544000 [Aphelenchoides besseyi]